MRPTLAQLAASTVALVVVAAMGVTAGLLLAADGTPRPLRSAATVDEAPVTGRPFSDVRSVEVDLRPGAASALSSPVDGRVTAFDCAPGESFLSGRSNLQVDGVPIVNLSTRVPLWRDLSRGDTGADVSALQEELVRLGHPLGIDGVVGSETLSGVQDVLEPDARAGPRLDTVPASRFLWLPHPRTAVAACATSTGSRIAADGDVASLAVGLVSAAIGALPDDAAPGDRVLVIDGRDVPVGAHGTIVDPDSLAAIAASSLYAEAQRNSVTSITADLALAHPIVAAAVPPGALYAIDGTTACVVADGSTRKATILGSELGVTFIALPGGDIPSAVDLTPRGASSCG